MNRSAGLGTTSGGDFVYENIENLFELGSFRKHRYLEVEQQHSRIGVGHYLLSSQCSLIFVALRHNLEYLLNTSTIFCSTSLHTLTVTGAF